jgi:outer membrane receptor protein involved in Fe transport
MTILQWYIAPANESSSVIYQIDQSMKRQIAAIKQRGVCRAAGLCLALTPVVAAAQEQEQLRVIARKPPVSAAGEQLGFISMVSPDEVAAPPLNLAELAVSQPGVAYTGQGGLFQTVSIRGLSRARIGSFYLDIPILTERRAGTAASFIDPGLLASMEVIRGPASTHYGSGNVGGLLALQPRRTSGAHLALGLGSEGDQNSQILGLGGERSHLMLSHRGTNDTDTAAGEPLHTGFDQYNLMLDSGGEIGEIGEMGEISWNLNTLLSYGSDIGKSNNLFPDQRVSDYPRERHWLAQLSLAQPGNWQGSVYFHYQDLETSVLRIDSRLNEVDNESLDIGTHWLAEFGSDARPLRIGLDWLGRFGVKADEQETLFADDSVRRRDNLDADQQELAIFADSSREFQALLLTGGLRGTLIWQDADNWSSESEAFISAFAGARWTLSDTVHFDAELARGDRAPSLSERFFSGTTGRSQVLGNPDLDREKVTSLDLGVIWQTSTVRLELHGYYQDIDDFIERVPVTEDTLGFRNISEGEIYGADLAFEWQLSTDWSLQAGGQLIDSEDKHGDSLQDVPADEINLGLQYQRAAWRGRVAYAHRFSTSDVAASELPFDSARLLTASLNWQLGKTVSVGLWGRNLLDDEYRISSDDLGTEGEQRAFGINLQWHPGA